MHALGDAKGKGWWSLCLRRPLLAVLAALLACEIQQLLAALLAFTTRHSSTRAWHVEEVGLLRLHPAPVSYPAPPAGQRERGRGEQQRRGRGGRRTDCG